jgi:nicotinamide-nucleotide amidase
MNIGFLIIGSEVLDGKITDLNTKILTGFLLQEGFELGMTITVRDDKRSIQNSLRHLFEDHDVVVTSGGLGPTRDDITKDSLGDFFNRVLTLNPEAIRVSQENYARFGREFPGPQHGYAFLPQGFVPMSNCTGFAPGFYLKDGDRILFSAPGVPREFQSMLRDHFMSVVAEKRKENSIFKHFIVRTKNIPEEKIFAEVDPTLWEKLETYGVVSSLPILMGVDVGVKVVAHTQEELDQKMRKLQSIVLSSPLSKNIWHIGQESLEEKIVKTANEKNITYGFAESATGGLCSHRVTSISGSSKTFMGSIVCYDEKVKEKELRVRRKTLDQFSAVSPETASEMAQGLLEKLNIDIAISITGYAGPSGGTPKFPIGSVCIGLATKKKTATQIFQLNGDREVLKQRFSQAALYTLLEELENFS